MLQINVVPHRNYLIADKPNQKLFVGVYFEPSEEAKSKTANLNSVIVIDVSGSMSENVSESKTKLDLVIEALHSLVNSELFSSEDVLSIIAFDNRTYRLVEPTEIKNKDIFHSAIDKLKEIGGGGTSIGPALHLAVQQFYEVTQSYIKKIFIFTDGLSNVKEIDEPDCEYAARKASERDIIIEPYGVGIEYNENLLMRIADITRGTPVHLQNMSMFHKEISKDIKESKMEVITDVKLEIKTIKDVNIEKVARVEPSICELEKEGQYYKVGNVTSTGTSIVIFLDLPSKPSGEVRVAQISVSYSVPLWNINNSVKTYDLIVKFTNDNTLAAQISGLQVLELVQKLNVFHLVKQALTQKGDEQQNTIQLAKELTKRLGNTAVTKTLVMAEKALKEGKGLGPELTKILLIDSKTKTRKIDNL